MIISRTELKRGIEVDYPAKRGIIKALRWSPKTRAYEFYNIKTGEIDYRYNELQQLVSNLNTIYNLKDVVGKEKLKKLI